LVSDEEKLHQPALSLSIYPNPASREVTIHHETELKQEIRLIVYNMDGQQLFSSQFTGHTILNVRDFQKGLYIIAIITPSQSSYKKLLVQ
jgi:hypothetical protein